MKVNLTLEYNIRQIARPTQKREGFMHSLYVIAVSVSKANICFFLFSGCNALWSCILPANNVWTVRVSPSS